MMNFLWQQQVLLKDFKDFALQATDDLRRATEQFARDQQRPLLYLAGNDHRKEDLARQVIDRDGLTEGLVAIFSAVEPAGLRSPQGPAEARSWCCVAGRAEGACTTTTTIWMLRSGVSDAVADVVPLHACTSASAAASG